MTNKHRQPRDDLADGAQTISHVAIADHYELRWMTGRKMPDGMQYVDLHSVPNGRRVHGCIAADPDAIRALLADHDAKHTALELVRMSAGWQYMSDETRQIVIAALAQEHGDSDAKG